MLIYDPRTRELRRERRWADRALQSLALAIEPTLVVIGGPALVLAVVTLLMLVAR